MYLFSFELGEKLPDANKLKSVHIRGLGLVPSLHYISYSAWKQIVERLWITSIPSGTSFTAKGRVVRDATLRSSCSVAATNMTDGSDLHPHIPGSVRSAYRFCSVKSKLVLVLVVSILIKSSSI